MEQEINHYKIIGVYPSDSVEYIEKQAKLKIIKIKAALARKDYQMLDVSTDIDDARLKQVAIEKIAEIEEAKEILLNPKTRKEFDVKTYGKSYLKKKRKKRDPKKYEKLKAFLGKKEDVTTAIVYAIAILIAGFIWFVVLPEGSNERSNTTKSDFPEREIKCYTQGNNYAAKSKNLFEKAVHFGVQKDYIALEKLLNSNLVFRLNSGIQVHIEDRAGFLGAVIKIRPVGKITTYWTNTEAVNCQ
ncbi:hypothetical protein PN36_18505 [Candidatus Thiomargarita nelsonii]|uniref:J domain-containing protein n=1 Tax=Candidatus Thiomargarita nelsonii TaxID=1003181 RepID=A0A0A6PI53_9GAMM|nr:hypothetical protein PN36_18505 [Candidatus Thiomargarita nelsonii]